MHKNNLLILPEDGTGKLMRKCFESACCLAKADAGFLFLNLDNEQKGYLGYKLELSDSTVRLERAEDFARQILKEQRLANFSLLPLQTNGKIIGDAVLFFSSGTIEHPGHKDNLRPLSEMLAAAIECALKEIETRKQLQEYNYNWGLVLECLPEGVSLHDSNGRILFISKKLAELYQVQPEEVLGLSCEQVFHIQGYRCPHEEAITQMKTSYSEIERQNTGQTLGIRVEPVIDQSGKVLGWIRLVADITLMKEVESEILRAERFALVGQMASGIAHEVGTPLNVISGYAEYLLMKTQPESAGHKELSAILQQTKRITQLIRQLFELVRPSDGSPGQIGFETFISETMEMIGYHLRKAGITVDLVTNIPALLISADVASLRQAIFNLLLNLIRGTERGGKIEIRVDELSAQTNSSSITREIKIAVSAQNGNGQQINLTRALAPFLKERGQLPGRDFGFFLTQRVIENHGGRISLEEDLEKLSQCVAIYLPVRSAQAAKRMGLDWETS